MSELPPVNSFPPEGVLVEAARGALSSREREEAYLKALEEEIKIADELDARCREDGYFWLVNYVYTFDEHSVFDDQIKLFPDVRQQDGKQPFKIIWDVLKTSPRIICIKSRQIMQTWIHGAETLHTALYGGSAVRLPVQSETQELANALLERIVFMYSMLPVWMKERHPLRERPTASKLKIAPPKGMKGPGSLIVAVPQGAHKLRSFTNTKVFMDEGAFQPECRDAIRGSRPTITGGGRLHIVTTVNGQEVCYELFTDQPATVPRNKLGTRLIEEHPCKGVWVRRNRNGWTALELDYCMLPWRDPDTPEGKAWEEEEKGSMPASDWEREYKRSFDTYDGTPVYGSEFKPGIHSQEKIEFRDDWPVFRGWDYGYTRPACLIGQITSSGQIRCVYELLGKNVPIQVFADIVLWVTGQNLSRGPGVSPDFVRDDDAWLKRQQEKARDIHDRRLQKIIEAVDNRCIEGVSRFEDLPRFTQLASAKFLDYDDPAGKQHNALSEKTARDILNARGIYPTPGEERAKRRVDITRERLLPNANTTEPMLIVSEEHCPILYTGLRSGYRYPEEKYGRDTSSVPVKDGFYEHLVNALEYVVTARTFIEQESYGKPELPANSIAGMRQARLKAQWALQPLRL